jgi:hypothetical protein
MKKVKLTSRRVSCEISIGIFLSIFLSQTRTLAEDPQIQTSSGMAYLN